MTSRAQTLSTTTQSKKLDLQGTSLYSYSFDEHETESTTFMDDNIETYASLVLRLGEIHHKCRQIVFASDSDMAVARLFPLTNSWVDALQRAGDAIARSSLNGPIGIVDTVSFHSGNPFILERGCTLLIADNCSASTLIASGAVEVFARSLRKVPTKHPFYLSTAIKVSQIIVHAFDGASNETASRLLASECDVALTDLLTWADCNADVFMPPLTKGKMKSGVDYFALNPNARVLLQVAVVDDIGSETVIGVIPSGAIVSLLDMHGEWVQVSYDAGSTGEEKKVSFRGWCIRQSLRNDLLCLVYPGQDSYGPEHN